MKVDTSYLIYGTPCYATRPNHRGILAYGAPDTHPTGCVRGEGQRGGTSFVQSSEDEIHSYYTNSGSSQQKQFSCSEDGMLYTATETSAKGKKSFSVLTKEFIIVVIHYHRNETVL